MEVRIEGLRVRMDAMEAEVKGLRAAKHEHEGKLGALTTLAEVGAEQRGELLKDVATLGADVRSGFRELREQASRDVEQLRADTAGEFKRRDAAQWRIIGLSISGGVAMGALLVQVAHGF